MGEFVSPSLFIYMEHYINLKVGLDIYQDMFAIFFYVSAEVSSGELLRKVHKRKIVLVDFYLHLSDLFRISP